MVVVGCSAPSASLTRAGTIAGIFALALSAAQSTMHPRCSPTRRAPTRGAMRWDATCAHARSSESKHGPPTIESVDGRRRLITTTHTLKGAPLTARNTYDAAGSLLSKTDPENNTASYGYDGRGRRTLLTDPDQGSHSFVYDGTG